MKKLLACVTVMIVTLTVSAVPVSLEMAQKAAGNWLARNSEVLGAKFKSGERIMVKSAKDADGGSLFYVAEMSSGGFVVMSADTEIPPVVAFSSDEKFDWGEKSPLLDILQYDQAARLKASLSSGKSAYPTTSSASHHGKVNVAKAGPAARWEQLLDGAALEKQRSVDVPSDLRVPVLLRTKWDQSTWGNYSDTGNTYNYYTPNNYVCGCVATACAQIMKFWEYPTGSVAQFTNPDCYIDDISTPRTSLPGAFAWSSMPLSYDDHPSITDNERMAIGKLTYNAGVAVGMNWTGVGSAASTSMIADQLRSIYGYASGTFVSYQTGSGAALSGDAENALYASLDAGMPVSMSIGGNVGGHSVVADGYGYSSGTRYTHINMGWSGCDDVWYALMSEPIVTSIGSFTTIRGLGFNIHPTLSGDIVSGMVRDSSGSAVSGATVSLYSSSGSFLSQTTSNSRGIYYFRVTSSGIYRVSATNGSLESGEVTVVVSSLSSSWSGSGNRWGNNLTLRGRSQLPDLLFEAYTNTWPAAVYISSTSAGRTAETSFSSSDTLYLHVSFGNGGAVQVGNHYKIHHQVFRNGEIVSSWIYDTVDHDQMEPGLHCYWDGYAWSGLSCLADGNYLYRCTLDSADNVAEENESNNVVEYSFTVGGGVIGIPFGDALDNSSLPFTTYGDANWFGQTTTYSYGASAAQSGDISDGQTSCLQTTVLSENGGVLSFRWKVSSEANWDKLHLYIDGTENMVISGEEDWADVSVDLAAGSHVVKWEYSKDVSVSIGSDCGWVDHVVWTPFVSSSVVVTFEPNGGTVALTSRSCTAGDTFYYLPRPTRPGYLFTGWFTAVSGGSEKNVADIVPSSNITLYAHWMESDITLGEALCDDGLEFSSGGDAAWIPQARYTFDGEAAGTSGIIGANQSSWVETVVVGPGVLSFRWAVSSENNYDKFRFFIDGEEQDLIMGATGWEEGLYDIGSGAHTVRWVYTKDGSVDRGWDCGFLDAIDWEPVVTTVTVYFDGNGGNVGEPSRDYELGGTYEYLPGATRGEGYAFLGWYTAADGGSLITPDMDVDPSITTLYAHWRYSATTQIGQVVNCPGYTFTSDGDASWFGQSVDSVDGDGAAQSGAISHGQTSWMETTCTGDNTLTFWWKTSSEAGYDYLRLYVDGNAVDEISGETGWEFCEVAVHGDGLHTVRWVYSKDISVNRGEDCARVDCITFTNTPETPDIPSDGHDYALCVGVNEYATSYIPSYNWLSCCVIDINNMRSMLVGGCSWPNSAVTTISDASCTKYEIRSRLQALAARAVAGDRVVYYHSSHGGQVSGTSTYLCAYDGNIMDTEFAEWLSEFNSGVKLLIVIDACHSGGMFKGYGSNNTLLDLPSFINRVSSRIDEIRYEQFAIGRKGAPKIVSSEIGWITAADYDQYSWGGSLGSSFTRTFCDCVKTGECDLTSQGGDGNGVYTAYEAAIYAQSYWMNQTINGYSMTPQYFNDSALMAFAFNQNREEPELGIPDLRWTVPSDWPDAMFLSVNEDGGSVDDVFDDDEIIYMFGAFQNAGTSATTGPVDILHEVIDDATGNIVVSWTYTHPSVITADSSNYLCWFGACWDELNMLPVGTYQYRVTIDPEHSISDSDYYNNVVVFEFERTGLQTVDVSFNTCGGDVCADGRYVIGATYGSLPQPTRDGYNFAGWYTLPSGGTRVDENTIVLETITTLYAHWTEIRYANLTFSYFEASHNSVAPGGQFALAMTVTNNGNASANANRVAIEVVEDGGNVATTCGYIAIPALDVGESTDVNFVVSHVAFTNSAVYHAVVDSDCVVDETDESDNVSSEVLVSIVIDTPPAWTRDDVIPDAQAFPTVFEQMHVTINGLDAPSGDLIGVFRAGSNEMCGLGEIGAGGLATFFIRVVDGTTVTFKVWDPRYGVMSATSANDVTVVSGSIYTAKMLAVTSEAPNPIGSLDVTFARAGWHLMSINVQPDDPSPSSIFGEIVSGMDYVIGDNALWSPRFGGGLGMIEIGKGYWIHTTVDGVRLAVEGVGDPTKVISLVAGWNMVGYTLGDASQAANALASLMATGKVRFVCTTDNSALFPASPLLMTPGAGYWIYASEPVTFSYVATEAAKGEAPVAKVDGSDPWAGTSLASDGVAPSVFEQVPVSVSGVSAAKGDCVAAFSDGVLYGRGVVDESGCASFYVMASAGKVVNFKIWVASTGDVIDSSTSYPISESGLIISDLSLDFGEPVPITYTVTFNANGGAGSMAAQTFTQGVAQALTANAFTRTGYTFAGWATSASGAVVYSNGQNVTLSANTMLYAIWTPLPEPVYGTFAGASALSTASGRVTASTDGAAHEDGELLSEFRSAATNTVWWVWTAPSSGMVLFNTEGSDIDTVMGVYTGSSLDSLAVVSENDDVLGAFAAACAFNAVQGRRYYIAVAGYGSTGDVVLSWGVPAICTVTFSANGGIGAMSSQTFTQGVPQALRANAFSYVGYEFSGWSSQPDPDSDDAWWFDNEEEVVVMGNSTLYAIWTPLSEPVYGTFAGAAALSTASGRVTASTDGAAHEDGEPLSEFRSAATNTVWWVWTAPSSGMVLFNTEGSDIDTVMGVYTGSSLDSLAVVSENDDVLGSYAAACAFNAVQGMRYYIAVAGYGLTGDIVLSWGVPATCTVTFNANGGIGAMSSQTFTQGVPQALRANAFSCMDMGYEFSGWSSQSDPDSEDAWWFDNEEEVVVMGNSTLYAVWDVPYNGWFDDAVTLFGNSGNVIGYARRGSYEYGEPLVEYVSSATNTLWWVWTAPVDGEVEFSTEGSDCDTVMGVYAGSSLYALSVIDENDDVDDDLYSECRFAAVAGRKYYVAVAPYSEFEYNDKIELSWWLTPNSYTVTFNANGGIGAMAAQTFTQGVAQALTASAFTRKMHAFVGWALSPDGEAVYADRQMVENLTTVADGVVTLYAVWEKTMNELCPSSDVEGAVSPAAASVYDGYLRTGDGAIVGTIQVKVGKLGRDGNAAVKATVIGLDGKKMSLKAAEKGKVPIASDASTTIRLVGGEACEVTLGAKGMGGTYGNYFIDGGLNVFASKEAANTATASAVLGKWQGSVNVAWLDGDGSPYHTLSVTIASKGKAKVAGTLANGTKVTANSQLIVGDEWCCVPVLESKKSHLAFVLWLPKSGEDATGRFSPSVVGLGENVKVGKPGVLKSGSKFHLDALLGAAKYADYLPNVSVTGGAKWVLPKAGKVQLAKDGSGSVDSTKAGENPSALKLTYMAKTGSFKGSFKAYSDVNGKPKGVTVTVTGVLVDGVGYGAATIKKAGGVSVTISPK